jgi:hypothetical protein
MKSWSLAKAVAVGACVTYGLAFLLALVAWPFWLTIAILWAPAALLLDSGVTSCVPWLALLVLAPVMGLGGYVAASRVERGKLLAGLLLSLLIALLCLPSLSGSAPAVLSGLLIALWALVFPILGAIVGKKWLPCRIELRLLKRAWLLTGQAAFTSGLLLPVGAGLVLFLYPRAQPEQDMSLYSRAPSPVAVAGSVAAAGFLLLAYGAFVFVKTKGWRRGLWANAYAWLSVAAVAAFAAGFVARDRANRADIDARDRMAAEMDRSFRYPDDDNGALLYAQAGAMLPRDSGPTDLPDLGVWREQDHPETAEWLHDQAEAISLALKASETSGGRFPQRFEAEEWGWSLAGVNVLATALLAQSGLAAGSSGVPDALRYLRPVVQMADILAEQKFLHGPVGMSMLSRVLRMTRDILDRPGLTAQDLRAIQAELATWASPEVPSRSAWEESVRCELGSFFEETFFTLRMKNAGSYLSSQFVPKAAGEAMERAVVDDILRAPSWLGMYRRFEEESERGIDLLFQPATAPFLGEARRKLEGLARSSLDIDSGCLAQILSDRAGLRLLQADAASRLFALDHGALPQSWSDLVPDYLKSVPLDPFTDSGLTLRAQPDGLVLYSVGRDMEDDGPSGIFFRSGKEEEGLPDEAVGGDDIVLRIATPRSKPELGQ